MKCDTLVNLLVERSLHVQRLSGSDVYMSTLLSSVSCVYRLSCSKSQKLIIIVKIIINTNQNRTIFLCTGPLFA